MSSAGAASSPSPVGFPPPPRRRLRRILLVATGVVVTLAVLIAGIGALMLHRFDHSVARADLIQPSARAQAPARAHGVVTGPLNFLLLGSDYRVEDPTMGERSDTIIVAHIPRSMERVYLVSIPRDLLVQIPPDPALDFGGDYTKINAAFDYGHGGLGGAQLVSATLTNLIGIRFDGAASIDFTGMKRVVDILGGVQMCIDTDVVSIHTGHHFTVGCQLLNSTDALDYLRQRDFPDGDFTRQRHQQQFLKAVYRQLLTAGTLTNPARLDALLQALAGTMTVDAGGPSIPDLIFALRGVRPDDVAGIKIPYGLAMINDTSYVVASEDAPTLYEALRSDRLDAWAADNPSWVNTI
jgi:LCP family protein required for cell wall assembly